MSIEGTGVFLHPDGYIELVFVGVQEAELLQRLIKQTNELVEEHGPIALLVDGRRGRVNPDAKSFSLLLSLRRQPKLRKIVIITTDDPDQKTAVQGPGVVTLIITSALGLHPTYTSDESEARQLAAAEK